MPISLKEAIAHIDRGIAKAEQLGLTLSFVVIDEFGQLVQLDRMDGAPLMSPDIAEAKAVTALNFKCPTSEVSRMSAEAVKSIADVVSFKVVAIPGGVPIFDGGRIKGAIGVSGANVEQEEEVAAYAADR